MAISLATAKPANTRNPKIGDMVRLFQFPNNRYVQIRLLDKPWLSTAVHWITIIGSKSNKESSIPKNCLAYNQETDEIGEETCPFCELDGKAGKPQKAYYVNAIIREVEDGRPSSAGKPSLKEKKTGYIDGIDSPTWTPVQVIRLTSTVVQNIQKLAQLNVHKIDGKRTQVHVSDPDFGMDISILYDKDASGSDKYKVQANHASSALDATELSYLCWDMTNPDLYIVDTLRDAQEDLSRMDVTLSVEDKENAKKGRKKQDEPDEDIEDLEFGPKSQASSKRRTATDDEEPQRKPATRRSKFDDEEDEEPVKPAARRAKPAVDDEEDEEPVKKPVRRARPAVAEDDDEEPVKKPATRRTAKPAVAEDEEPVKKPAARRTVKQEVEEEEDEEPIKPTARCTKPVETVAKPAARRAKPEVDVEEEDEEPVKPAARRTKPAAEEPKRGTRAAKPAAVVDDEDIPWED